jgi:hypothetical protein
VPLSSNRPPVAAEAAPPAHMLGAMAACGLEAR